NPQSAAEGYFSIAGDPSGDLWLGSTSGLYRFTPGTGAFQPYLHKSGAAETLSNNTVNTVLMDKQGALWVGTQNGLNLFDRERGTFRRFVKRDGLPGDVVSCLLEDGSGDLWMSTNNGMARLDRAALTFTSFSVADGLPGNDLSGWNACDKAPSGEMVFGGFSGATAFRPDQVSVAETQPPVLISEVRLGGAPLTPSELHPRGIRQEAVLDVPSGRDEIVVSYAALYFRAPSARTIPLPAARPRRRLARGRERPAHGELQRLARRRLPIRGPGQDRPQRLERAGGRAHHQCPSAVVANVWFRAAALAFVAAAAVVAYRIRLRQVSRQYAIRLEERLNERSRIARELHDSLLQSFQGLIFRLQAIRNVLPGQP